MSSTRRDLLRGGLAAAILAGCRTVKPAARPAAPHVAPRAIAPRPVYTGRPRYVVEVMLSGGLDALLTVDAKDQSAIGDAVDCGYRADQRVQGSQRLFGPLIGDLVRHDAVLCLVHGVRYDTVSHSDGVRICSAGKVSYKGSSAFAPKLADQLPGGAPVPVLQIYCAAPSLDPTIPEVPRGDLLGLYGGTDYSPTITPASFLRTAARIRTQDVPWDELHRSAVEDLAPPGSDPGIVDDLTALAEEQRAVRDLMMQVSLTPTFGASPTGDGLSIALAALRGNLARYIRVQNQLLWFDSHTDNYSLQQQRIVPAFADLAAFIDQLKVTRNEYGPLSEQTTIVVRSEIGRYPKLNQAHGKDHFPESSWLLLGAGVRRGATVGETNARYQGVPVNRGTGTPDPEGAPITVDVVIATLFKIASADPATHGYRQDQILPCMIA